MAGITPEKAAPLIDPVRLAISLSVCWLIYKQDYTELLDGFQ